MSRKQSAKSKKNKVKEELDNTFAEYFALLNMVALVEPDDEDKVALTRWLTRCFEKLNKVLKRIYEKHEMLQADEDEIMSRWIKMGVDMN